MPSENHLDVERGGDRDDSGTIEIFEGYRLWTDRTEVLLEKWIEAIQVVNQPEDFAVLDSLRHAVKMTLDEGSHEKMLRAVSVSVATQICGPESQSGTES